MRSATLARAVFAVPLLFILACGGDQAGSVADVGGDPVPGGTAVIGVLSDFQAFNPVTNTALLTDEVIKHMLYTPIIQYDADLTPQPFLAESWDLTETGVTFHLRNDVMWHDGQPVTAEDVKFTFDLAKNEETASLLGSAYLTLVSAATVIDPQTIQFTFVEPHSQPLDAFWWPPLPSHLLQDVAPAELAQAEYNRSPVGSGPFRFGSWESGQRLTLERNENFPEALGGPPHLERVVFRIIPEPTTMLTELLSGGADMIGYTLLPEQARQLEGQRGVELVHFPSREFTYIGWNNQRPQFNDAETRRALTMAINRPQLIEALMHGLAQPASGMIPSWSPMDPGLDPLPYDLNAANQLLDQAGWSPAAAGGVRTRNGQQLSFTMLVNAANRTHQDIATVVQQQLREIGAQVEIRTVEFQTMLRQHRARDYDAVISNWSLDTFKVDPTPLFSCEQARTEQSANRAGYCNPQADQLMQRGLRINDESEARRIWREFSELLQQDQPITFLWWSEDIGGYGPRLQNVEADVRSKIVNIREWWIPEQMQR